MKICVTSQGKDIDSTIDSRFGRCQYFLIIDSETMKVTVLQNESQMASGGAGIQAAQTVAKTDVKTVATGNIGPNAFKILQAADIKVITGVEGKIKDIIEKIVNDELKETHEPNVSNHFGMNK